MPTESRGLGELPRKNSLKPFVRTKSVGQATPGATVVTSPGDRRRGRPRADCSDVGELRLLQIPDRSNLNVSARPKAKAAKARTGRQFELDPAHVISMAAKRVADVLGFEQLAGVIVAAPDDARPDAADVEPAQRRRRAEEAIGQPDRIRAGRRALLERVDVAALGVRGEDEPVLLAPIFRRVGAAAQVAHVAANAGEILGQQRPLAPRRPDAVGVIEAERIADRRDDAAADLVAQIASRLQRVALEALRPGRRRDRYSKRSWTA